MGKPSLPQLYTMEQMWMNVTQASEKCHSASCAPPVRPIRHAPSSEDHLSEIGGQPWNFSIREFPLLGICFIFFLCSPTLPHSISNNWLRCPHESALLKGQLAGPHTPINSPMDPGYQAIGSSLSEPGAWLLPQPLCNHGHLLHSLHLLPLPRSRPHQFS